MSNYAIIHDTTLELRRQIVAALVSAPDADLDITENEITLALPTNDLVGAPRLSLYLYHIEADANLRNQKRLDVGPNGQRFPPLALKRRQHTYWRLRWGGESSYHGRSFKLQQHDSA